MTKLSLAASITAAVTRFKRLISRIRSACVSRRPKRRKFPPVTRMMVATVSGSNSSESGSAALIVPALVPRSAREIRARSRFENKTVGNVPGAFLFLAFQLTRPTPPASKIERICSRLAIFRRSASSTKMSRVGSPMARCLSEYLRQTCPNVGLRVGSFSENQL